MAEIKKKQRKIYPIWIILGFCLIHLAILYAVYGFKPKEVQVASEFLAAGFIILLLIFFGVLLIYIGLAVCELEKEG